MQAQTDPVQEGKQTRRAKKRQQRAETLRRKALSPWRILLMILALPLSVALISIGVFVRVSAFDREGAVVHLIAMAGCDVAWKMGIGPFYLGGPGYHARYDPDNNGVTCEPPGFAEAGLSGQASQSNEAQPQNTSPKQRTLGTAKFLKP